MRVGRPKSEDRRLNLKPVKRFLVRGVDLRSSDFRLPTLSSQRMHLKDYYKTLELEPSATHEEIKRSYRRLAQLYHPDKTQNDPYAAAQFAEVKEAYEVLNNPTRKSHYLQQRWYQQSIGKKRTQETITPVSVLKQSLELDRYVSLLDVHRMDREGLLAYMSEIVSDDVLEKLPHFHEPAIKKEIAGILLHCSDLLTPQHRVSGVGMQKHTCSG